MFSYSSAAIKIIPTLYLDYTGTYLPAVLASTFVNTALFNTAA